MDRQWQIPDVDNQLRPPVVPALPQLPLLQSSQPRAPSLTQRLLSWSKELPVFAKVSKLEKDIQCPETARPTTQYITIEADRLLARKIPDSGRDNPVRDQVRQML